jgi:2-keto-4-pentenoate hydratase/2-oxohepta-3-ene-1,7-dioic acid hydratase in catechol pathway
MMRLFAFEAGHETRLGVERAGAMHDITRGAVRDFGKRALADLIAADQLDALAAAVDEDTLLLEEMPGHWTFAPPILRPGKIIAMVQNYQKHAAEFGNTAPPEPTWFAKLPSSLCGHEATIVIPRWLEGRVDHEVELAVVIGRRCKDVPAQSAPDVIAGYSVLNDVSARRVQKQDREKQHPWTRCKNLDTFTPMGPYFVPARFVSDPNALRIACRVNGEIRQNATTADMIHPVAKQIAEMSRWMTLEPGDVIATGTPEGVGPLNDGDVCECEIQGVGLLRNRVSRPA